MQPVGKAWECTTPCCGILPTMRALAMALLVGCSSSSASEPVEIAVPVAKSEPIVGTTPPEWQAERWINSPPRSLASLRGSVVLVRWWTAGCPFCSASAPALREFDRAYRARGLQVIGMYHHKEATPFEPKVYEDTAKKYGFTFPLAFDAEWHTLQSWLRDSEGKPVDTGFTSVTFLLDRQGVIRHVHPGGQYVAGDPAHAELDRKIRELL